jgi:5-methylcytosine-specific restriction endonuclease McrA
MEKPCEICGSVMNVKPCRYDLRRFCSNRCLSVHRDKEKQADKVCGVCGISKPRSEFWKKTRDVVQSFCKSCGTSVNKKNDQKYSDSNKERRKRYYENNKEEIIKKVSQWNKNNPEKRVRYMTVENQKRRARKKQAGGSFVRSQWLKLLKEFGGKCVYCGSSVKMSMDHFVPLSKGGSHCHGNIVPSCMNCNSNKRENDPMDWVVKNFGRDKYDELVKYLSSKK